MKIVYTFNISMFLTEISFVTHLSNSEIDMTYSTNMPSAARRHLLAADILFHDGKRCDVAGYLYGIAAECAIKAILMEEGYRPIVNSKDDPLFAHLPQLRTLLRDRQFGRKAIILSHFINNDNFFSQWDIKMRYCAGSEIKGNWIYTWKGQASDVVASIGT